MPPRVVCALLDSGVDPQRLPSRHATRAITVKSIGPSGAWTDCVPSDALGHGTANATLVLDASPWIDLVVWRVFDDGPNGGFDRIVSAFQAAFRAGCDVVACPLGTPDPILGSRIEPLVAMASAAGIAVVAPLSFHGLPAFPGSCRSAVGVSTDASLAGDRTPLAEGARWRASAAPPADFPDFPAGPSYATSRVAGHLARLRAEPSC